MAELRRSIWLHSAVVLVALAALLAGYLWQEMKPHSWPFPPERSELAAKIKEIQDIEHLRKVSLLLVKGSNDLASDANEAVRGAIELVFVLLGCVALVAALSVLSLLKHLRKTEGRPVGWLRWL